MPEESTPADEPAETESASGSTASAPPPASPAVTAPDSGYTASGVPTLEGVREKIETRYGTALGSTELAAETPEARTAAEQYEERQRAAADKLAEIRKSMDSGPAES